MAILECGRREELLYTEKKKNFKIITGFVLYSFKKFNWIFTQLRHYLDQNSLQNYVYISCRFVSGISFEFRSCGILYFKEDYHDGNEFFLQAKCREGDSIAFIL